MMILITFGLRARFGAMEKSNAYKKDAVPIEVNGKPDKATQQKTSFPLTPADFHCFAMLCVQFDCALCASNICNNCKKHSSIFEN